MKPTAVFATLSFIIFIKIINGQHNGLVYNDNFETNTPALQQQPIHTYAMVNSVPELLNNNGNSIHLPNNINQHQILVQTNTPASSPSTPQIQIPPDLQQQPLQVQQYLQLQKPLQAQQPFTLPQALQLQPQMQPQLPLQQHPLQIQIDAQPQLIPIQLQDILQLQPQMQPQTPLQQHPLQIQIDAQSPLIPVQLQEILQYQPLMQTQVPLQQHPLQIQIDGQPPVIPLQLQDILQLQPESQSQHLVSYQPVPLQPLKLQQPIQSQQSLQTPQTLNLQQSLQSVDSLQSPLPMQFQQLGFQQISPQNLITISDSKKLPEIPCAQQRKNLQPDSQIRVKWQSSNPQPVVNVEIPHNAQNINIQPLQQAPNQPLQLFANVQPPVEIPQEVQSLRYYVLSQNPTPLSVPPTAPPVVSNWPSVTIPSNYIKPVEETYVPIVAPCSYVTPISEVHVSIPEIIKSGNSILPSPSILTRPNLPTESSVHYFNPQTDLTPNPYINQNQGFQYPQQSQVLVTTLQSQPSSVIPSQSSALSSVPISIVQASSAAPQYGVTASYPVNTVVAPAYTTNKSTSSNLKSVLPLIFKLLKEKITSCGCRNDCSCECKTKDNDVEVASGFSNQKDCKLFDSNGFSVLNAVSEEAEGPECIRETKNCDTKKKVASEPSSETIEEEEEEEDSDEGEIDEEDED